MAVDPQIAGIAARTPNFGFLLDHEPLLVVYGAEAESFVFTTPNTSMMKCRQFGEALVNALLAAFGIQVPPGADTASKRLKVLADQGVVNQRVHGWFTTVRRAGNKAVHEGYAAQQDALRLVRSCYELGAWFHRLVTDSRETPPFVPPQPLSPQLPPAGPAEAQALAELQEQLRAYGEELVEMRTSLDEQRSTAAAQADARRRAEAEILDAVGSQGDLRRLIEQLAGKVDGLQRDLEQRAEQPETLSPVRRDVLVERAQRASRPPLSEAEVRRTIDRMLHYTASGWRGGWPALLGPRWQVCPYPIC